MHKDNLYSDHSQESRNDCSMQALASISSFVLHAMVCDRSIALRTFTVLFTATCRRRVPDLSLAVASTASRLMHTGSPLLFVLPIFTTSLSLQAKGCTRPSSSKGTRYKARCIVASQWPTQLDIKSCMSL